MARRSAYAWAPRLWIPLRVRVALWILLNSVTMNGGVHPSNAERPGPGEPGADKLQQALGPDQSQRASNPAQPKGPGPEFLPPQAPPPRYPSPPPAANRYRPPSGRVSGAIFIAVVALVIAAMALTTYLDTRPRQPAASPAPAASTLPVPPNDKTVYFNSSEGRGELELLDQYWTDIGGTTYSMIQVRITSHRGNLTFWLGMFDPANAVVEASPQHSRQPTLIHGRVASGATRTGWAAFPMERGTTTLVMQNDLNESVIALRVPA